MENVFTLAQLSSATVERIPVGLRGFDRALGRGLVRNSLILFAGHAGSGKSSLMTLVSARIAASGRKVLYVSAEEALSQFALRAKRLRVNANGTLFITAEATLLSLKEKAAVIKPDVVIIDSIQSLRHTGSGPLCLENLRSARHFLAELMEFKKAVPAAIVLVGHETKSGDISGSAQLQHLVDVVLKLDLDELTGDRVLAVRKNRFAAVNGSYRFRINRRGEIREAPPVPTLEYRAPTVIS
ncbi:MAG: hypothetical protein A3J70_08275 [Elusimicrobia bacterium RIFCSPHIGHO2_02_FULL_61_10]|nr:MAG: hypothetical protein A3J70_08275 [Elusimicrobia bacterium RIFCSPHIGHO2_02_FULL_61_10]